METPEKHSPRVAGPSPDPAGASDSEVSKTFASLASTSPRLCRILTGRFIYELFIESPAFAVRGRGRRLSLRGGSAGPIVDPLEIGPTNPRVR